MNIGQYLFGRGMGHGFHRRVGGKECGRDEVDALVGALRREHDRHKELVGIVESQFALGNGHVVGEPCQGAGIAFAGGHFWSR